MFCHTCGHRLESTPPTRCSSCGVELWDDAKPTAGGLVVVQSRLLLIRRARDPWKGLWDIPGGFCNPGEHPVQTAQREILEETGLHVEVIGFLGMWLDGYEGTKRTLNAYYHATLVGSEHGVRDAGEVAEVGWFSCPELPVDLAFPGHIPAVLEAWKQAVDSGDLMTALRDRPGTTQS
jgi:ADP-ribose pyrophosphatase YjhB (NUDIX family)